MVNSFLILGLPRSRTQWLSNFMTYSGSFCYHELLSKVSSYDDYKTTMSDIDYSFVGDSDTAGLYISSLPEFKNTKKVIIHRDTSDVLDELYSLFGFCSKRTERIYEYNNILEKEEGLHIKFDEIDDNLEDIWNHLVSLPYDKKRANELLNMNIQIKDTDFIKQDSLLETLIKKESK